MGRYIVDERCLAKVKGTLVLRAVVRLIRPEQAVVTAVDELEDLGQATHATVFVQEGHAAREQEPHVFVVEREALKGRAGVQKRLEIGGDERTPQRGRLVKGGRQRCRKGQDRSADGYEDLRKDIWPKRRL